MNKKILTISLVAVAAITASVSTVLAFKNTSFKEFSKEALAGTGSKFILLTADSIDEDLTDENDGLLTISAPCAFDNSYTFTLDLIDFFGDELHFGRNGHLFEVSGSYWYIQKNFNLVGVTDGFESIQYCTRVAQDEYDVFAYRTAADYNAQETTVDGVKALSFTLFEDSYSGFGSSLTVDAIKINYTCE